MPFDFGAFAGGVGSGIEQGEDIRKRQMELTQQRVQQRAQAAVDNYLRSQQDGGQQGAQRPPVAVGGIPGLGGPGATPSPSGGAAPMAPGGGPPTNLPAPVARPMQPPAAMGQGAPPAPAGQPPPSAIPTGPQASAGPTGQIAPPQKAGPGATPPDQGGDQQPVDYNKQSLATIRGIASAIAAAQPKGYQWDRGELLEAVNTVLGAMKTIDPETRLLAETQLKAAQMQLAAFEKDQDRQSHERQTGERVGAEERGQDVRADTAREQIKAAYQRAQLASSTQLQKQSMGDATKIQATNIMQAGANERTAAVLEAKQQINDANIDEKTAIENLKAQLIEDGMDKTYVERLFAAQQGASPTAIAAPKTPPTRAKLIPPRGQGRPAPAAGGPANAGAEGPPPMAPSPEGKTVQSPGGVVWKVQGGKWVTQAKK